jgi:hypothetical protein
MFCIHCGASNPDQAAFCNACGKSAAGAAGTPIEKTPAQSRWRSRIKSSLLVLAGVVIFFLCTTVYKAAQEELKRQDAANARMSGSTAEHTPAVNAPAPNTAPLEPAPAPPPQAAPAPAPEPPPPQVRENTIVGKWKFSQLGGLGDFYLTLAEDGHYSLKTAFSSETGMYVFNSTDGSLRIQEEGFLYHEPEIWHCHLSRNSLAVMKDDGSHLMYYRVE